MIKPENDNSWMLPYIREAWNGGYQSAVDVLREMADEYGSEDMKKAIDTMANALQRVKPKL